MKIEIGTHARFVVKDAKSAAKSWVVELQEKKKGRWKVIEFGFYENKNKALKAALSLALVQVNKWPS